MSILNVCFIGVGSIAKRHIKNLETVCKDRNIQLCIDVVRRNRTNTKGLKEMGVRNVFSSAQDLETVYDAIFITNPTGLHLETLEKYHSFGKNFFIEKPVSLVSQIKLVQDFKLDTNKVYYVASPLRYSAVIQYIKNNIDLNKTISARCISSSYLPDWRPGTDYRDTYSANRKMGGGVDTDLIHEWDYITYLFGFPDLIKYIHGKKSRLEIDSDDLAIYIAEYKDKTVEVHLDYFGRSTIREIILFMEDDTVVGNLVKNEIIFLRKDKKIVFNETRDDYQKRELAYFLDMVYGKDANNNSIMNALGVLKLTQGEI